MKIMFQWMSRCQPKVKESINESKKKLRNSMKSTGKLSDYYPKLTDTEAFLEQVVPLLL